MFNQTMNFKRKRGARVKRGGPKDNALGKRIGANKVHEVSILDRKS